MPQPIPFFAGLDLGQQHDYTAVAILEALSPTELHLRHLERIPLGTSYPAVIERVRQLVTHPELLHRIHLAVDATGVGAPVVEMLRFSAPECPIASVTLTAGDREVPRPGGCNLPKRDLIAQLRLLLDRDELRISPHLPDTAALIKELVDIRATSRESGHTRLGADASGQHDDLVIALALACWAAKLQPPKRPPCGEQNTGRIV